MTYYYLYMQHGHWIVEICWNENVYFNWYSSWIRLNYLIKRNKIETVYLFQSRIVLKINARFPNIGIIIIIKRFTFRSAFNTCSLLLINNRGIFWSSFYLSIQTNDCTRENVISRNRFVFYQKLFFDSS